MQTIEVNIPQRLKELRKNRNYSQGQVAQRLGIKLRTYQAYEEGRASPRVRLLLRLAVVYELFSLDALIGVNCKI
jgi:transcriptional regulator with XRE-family HTH domain